jgi:hypothetical protein
MTGNWICGFIEYAYLVNSEKRYIFSLFMAKFELFNKVLN